MGIKGIACLKIREKDAVFTRKNSSNYLSIRRSKEDERTEALLVEMKEIAKRQTSETKRRRFCYFTVHTFLLAL
jgi:hypothetical protein